MAADTTTEPAPVPDGLEDDEATPKPTPDDDGPEAQVATTWYAPNQQCVHADTLGPALVHATGATAGVAGTGWTPAGADVPNTFAELKAGTPLPIVASPTTTWTTGQYVQTETAGTAGQGYWHATNGWVAGKAP